MRLDLGDEKQSGSIYFLAGEGWGYIMSFGMER